MKYKVLACGVFETYVRLLSRDCPNEIDLVALEAGLHDTPGELRTQVQREIDDAEGYDAVLLFYGLCGRGTAELVARRCPVVIPRVHDCISLFLGSGEAYLKQFSANPGTFYHTLGWIEKKINPRNRRASDVYRNYQAEGYDEHPEFEQLSERYGRENAQAVVEFMDSWKRNYTRGAYISMGLPEDESYSEFTRQMSEILGWQHEVLGGDLGFLRDVLWGRWDERRVLVLRPGHRSVSTGDDRVLDQSSIDDEERSNFEPDAVRVLFESERGSGAEGIGLGIDAGGTYTDAVIYDRGQRRVLAKAKALTTYQELIQGIRHAVGQLPRELLGQVQATALSTTLATNSIVEGRGYKVGLIVLSPWAETGEEIGHHPFVKVPGAVTISGDILEPLDEDACRAAVRKLALEEGCSALAVAGYATIRNPSIANRVREIAWDECHLPVVCDHELSRRINWKRRAHTAIANARLIPLIEELIESCKQALDEAGVSGRLMIVKGDGTPVDESVARQRPVETILSGPAASVMGATMLTGLADAMVLDIGGTTTDCAVVQEGRGAVSEDGARIGGRTLSVDAVEITTVGLGGDSRISFDRERKLLIGPVRNIPLAMLASEYPEALQMLEQFDPNRYPDAMDPSPMDILVCGAPGRLELSDQEKRLLQLLEEGPCLLTAAAAKLGLASPALLGLERLEAAGAVKRSSLTPTDLMHIRGTFRRWDERASSLGLQALAGLLGRKPELVLRDAEELFTRRLFEEIVRREVSFQEPKLHDLPRDWSLLLEKAFRDDGGGLGVKLVLRRPVVAIGAPAGALAPPVGSHLDTQILVPEDADVANAIGAIGSEVVAREEVLIQPGHLSNYVVHSSTQRLEFSELERATAAAMRLAQEAAVQKAIEAGAASPRVVLRQQDKTALESTGGRVFLGRRVEAVASGPVGIAAAV